MLDTYITNDDFEMPVTHHELGALITICTDLYKDMPRGVRTTSQYKRKLNELIDEYNEMRGMVIINYLK